MAVKAKYVMLKFRDAVNLPYADDIGGEIETQKIGQWTQLTVQFPGIRILRMYRSITVSQLQDLVTHARANDALYRPPNLLTCFVIEAPVTADVDGLAAELRRWPQVELAYVPGVAHTATGVSFTSSLLNPSQGYEDPAPKGVDARAAWTFPGGDGTGQAIVDLELGWTQNHVDFEVHNPALIDGFIEDIERSHGTSVLGIICAIGNTHGIVGIAPHVHSVNLVSYKTDLNFDANAADVPNAIAMAAASLSPGDVLLIEIEMNFMPCEADPLCSINIALATAAGIVVVEVAGNAGMNLDGFKDSFGNAIFLRQPGNSSFKDSLAIIVAASSETVPHKVLTDSSGQITSNFGSRIDCYAWGENVLSSQSLNAMDRLAHTSAPDFSQTSAAAAIIAGAALSVQGMRQAAGLKRFTPTELRTALRNGTASPDAIGIMPNLLAIGRQIVPPTGPLGSTPVLTNPKGRHG